MVLVIDTSSSCSALALVGNSGALAEDLSFDGREHDLAGRATALADPRSLHTVAVSLGPGSFTGLRVGVSYGIGLAMGLRVPLLGVDSLDIQAARAPGPVTPLVEAGRGRVYWRTLSGNLRVGGPAELPHESPAVGWLRRATADAVRAAGVRLLAEDELETFASAAASLLGTATELGYDTVKLRYMESVRTIRD